jgi:serine/threonine-protein kinase
MPDLINQTLLNRYRVIESLGRGGSAEVYKVWDAHRSSFLAIKVLHADLALDRVFIRRFKREAQTLARLQHPNIVRFYDLEQDGRLVFMLMDYVEGESLKHKIFDANGPMSLTQTLEIMRPLCQALHFAHKEGFVHSDVKPGNVLIDKTGRVMLTDFGIARVTETATVTMLGAGTPAYMSPEQARGESPSAQSDIYALGVILFEMLTGERPFTGENARTSGSTSEKTRWEQMNLPVPSPRKFNPNLSVELEAVVLKCLEKNAQSRYSSALEILTALQNAVSTSAKAEASTPNMDDASTIIIKQRPATFGKKRVIAPYLWMIAGSVIVLIVLMFARGNGNILIPPTLTPAPTNLPPTATLTPTSTNLPPTATLTPISILGIGSTQISPKDGMTLLYVPEGEFTMGSDIGDDNEQPVHSVYLDAFWIDQTEVTNAMYVLCVQAGTCQPPKYAKSSYTHTSYYGNSQYDDYPMINVDWNQAKTYCEWAERRLPSEAEWEKAARGTDGRTYPWGNDAPDSNLLNYGITMGDTTEVGKYPAGASIYGALDMAGNVWEWVMDRYDSNYYSNSPSHNPQGSASGQYRVLRGGSWLSYSSFVRSSVRDWDTPVFYDYRIGFRCVRSLP